MCDFFISLINFKMNTTKKLKEKKLHYEELC